MSYYREREPISPINKVKTILQQPKSRTSRYPFSSTSVSPSLGPESEFQIDTTSTTSLSVSLDGRKIDIESLVAEQDFTNLLSKLEHIVRDKSLGQRLLQTEGKHAQNLINILQKLLDSPGLSPALKSTCLKILLQLSTRTGLYPDTLVLKEVKREEESVTPGHFGDIWKGNYNSQTVCLKIVKVYLSSDTELLEQAFRKEALIWAHLSHPNLLPFYGMYRLDDSRGRLCLVSPWMDNGNTTSYLKENLDVDRFLLIDDIGRGISYLHESNIVHADLKGVNIMISPAGRACLGDFGLSAVHDSENLRWTSLQSTAQTGGTIRWQAPELFALESQDLNLKPTKASDMYAFACVCYEVLTGKVPFHEILNDFAVMMRVANRVRPSRPAEVPADIQIHGHWNFIWGLMTVSWETAPSERLQAKYVTERLASCKVPDPRQADDWGSVSPASFRQSQRAAAL